MGKHIHYDVCEITYPFYTLLDMWLLIYAGIKDIPR